MEIGKPFSEVLAEFDERQKRFDSAESRHRSATNPVLRAITGANLRLRSAQLRETHEHADLAAQLEHLSDGVPPID